MISLIENISWPIKERHYQTGKKITKLSRVATSSHPLQSSKVLEVIENPLQSKQKEQPQNTFKNFDQLFKDGYMKAFENYPLESDQSSILKFISVDSLKPFTWSNFQKEVLNEFSFSDKLTIEIWKEQGQELGWKDKLKRSSLINESGPKIVSMTQQEVEEYFQNLKMQIQDLWDRQERLKVMNLLQIAGKNLDSTYQEAAYPVKFCLIVSLFLFFGDLLHKRLGDHSHRSEESHVPMDLEDPEYGSTSNKQIIHKWYDLFRQQKSKSLLVLFEMSCMRALIQFSNVTTEDLLKINQEKVKEIQDLLLSTYLQSFICLSAFQYQKYTNIDFYLNSYRQCLEQMKPKVVISFEYWKTFQPAWQLILKTCQATTHQEQKEIFKRLSSDYVSFGLGNLYLLKCLLERLEDSFLTQPKIFSAYFEMISNVEPMKSESEQKAIICLQAELFLIFGKKVLKVFLETSKLSLSKEIMKKWIQQARIIYLNVFNQDLNLFLVLNCVYIALTAVYFSFGKELDFLLKEFILKIDEINDNIFKRFELSTLLDSCIKMILQTLIQTRKEEIQLFFQSECFLNLLDHLKSLDMKKDLCFYLIRIILSDFNEWRSDSVLVEGVFYIFKTLQETLEEKYWSDLQMTEKLLEYFLLKVSLPDYQKLLDIYAQFRAIFYKFPSLLPVLCYKALQLAHESKKKSSQKACFAFIHCTLISVNDSMLKVQIFHQTALLALQCQFYSQAETLLKAGFKSFSNLEKADDLEVISLVQSLLSSLLLFPSPSEKSSLYLVEKLLHICQELQWQSKDALIFLYLEFLNLLSALSQENMIFNQSSMNNALIYAGNDLYQQELNQMSLIVFNLIISYLDTLQSSKDKPEGRITDLCLLLVERILLMISLPKESKFIQLIVELIKTVHQNMNSNSSPSLFTKMIKVDRKQWLREIILYIKERAKKEAVNPDSESHSHMDSDSLFSTRDKKWLKLEDAYYQPAFEQLMIYISKL